MANETFLGLKPYSENDARHFKGRSIESEELSRLIIRNHYTVCYGESGEGKTSLLKAGVFPILRKNIFFPIEITFTKDDFDVAPNRFDSIIDRCIQDCIKDYNKMNIGVNVEYKCVTSDFNELDIEVQRQLKKELDVFSWWKIRNYKPTAMGLSFTPIFVFDQFEEVFSQPSSSVWTEMFFKWLEQVTSDSLPEEIIEKVRAIIGDHAAFPKIKEEKNFKAIFSLRNEFIGELDYWAMQKHFIPELKENRYYLKALSYEGAKMVMAQLGDSYDSDKKKEIESKAEEILVHLVKKHSKEPERTINENLPVIPALLLSVICESWEKNIESFSAIDSNEIEQSLYKVIEQFYNNACETTITDLSSQSRNQIQIDKIRNDIEAVVFALVDEKGKRERIKTTSSKLNAVDFDTKYKKTLEKKRIIRVSKINGEDYVELIHDALCPIIVNKKEQKLAIETQQLYKEKSQEHIRKSCLHVLALSIVAGVCIIAFMHISMLEKRITKTEQQRDSIQNEYNKYQMIPEHLRDSIVRANLEKQNEALHEVPEKDPNFDTAQVNNQLKDIK
jgi:hypothetical protein